MATREEIREGIAHLCAAGMRDCDYECATCVELDEVLKDVFIKVDRELPDGLCLCVLDGTITRYVPGLPDDEQPETRYFEVAPLIG